MSGPETPENPHDAAQEPTARADDGAPEAGSRKRAQTFFRGAMRHLGSVGRDVFSVAVGRWLQESEASSAAEAAPQPTRENQQRSKSLHQRVNVMHNVAERLRGAADTYIAAKMDEIEARVDEKLDHIEHRIDAKLIELHKQLAELRDRELRHRLRLLKITLIFTVFVALLSLAYKWISNQWL